MARPLSRRWRWRAETALWVSLALVLLAHLLALLALRQWLQPPSLLRQMAPPLYTRTIAPQAPPVAVAVAPAAAAPSAPPARPTARIRRARPSAADRADQSVATAPVEPAPVEPASAPERADEPSPEVPPLVDTLDEPQRLAEAPAPPASVPLATAPAPAEVASAPASAPAAAAPPAFLASWPGDTRLSYKLGGNYRGELHGDARVLWQRDGTRYHTAVELSAGLLVSLSFTSQGEITAEGLVPEVYEETLRGRRRGVRIGADVRLNDGTRVARPAAVQDTASQFVELGHRFSTGAVRLEPGAQVRFSMARPGGVDDWTYDVVGEEVLHLPRLGAMPTFHLKPRPLTKPRGPITAKIWYAPSLQYLPVRIRINQGPDTYIDLLVDRIEQQ